MPGNVASKRYFEPSPKSENATEANKRMKLLEGAKGDYGDVTLHRQPNLNTYGTYLPPNYQHHPPSPVYTNNERQRHQHQLGRQDGVTFAGSGHPEGNGCFVNTLQYGHPPSPPTETQASRANDCHYGYSYGNGYPSWDPQAQAAQAEYWSYYQHWYAQSMYQQPAPQPSAWWPEQYQYPLTQPSFVGGQVQQQLQSEVPFTQTRYPLRSLNATVPVFTPLNQPQLQQSAFSAAPQVSQSLPQSKQADDVLQPAQSKTAQKKARKEAKKMQQTLVQAGASKRRPNTGLPQLQSASATDKMTLEPGDSSGHRGVMQTQRLQILARPVPSASYMCRALEAPQRTGYSRPLLVILDLNGTLLFRKKHGGSNKFVARPHVHQFLDYLFSNHLVMVWSSARPENVTKMCSDLFTPKQSHQLVVMWGRDKLQLPSQAYWQKVQVYKQLTWVWYDNSVQIMNPRMGIERWDQSNTVLIDDSFEKAASEPHNLVQIDEFEGKEEQMQDDVLSQVEQYLDTLRTQANVSAYMRAKPFKYLPVNDTAGNTMLDRAGTSLQQP